MTHPVQTGELSTDRVEQAWPLVREIAPGISLDSWCAYARGMLSPIDPERDVRGIIAVQRKRTIRGLVTYETIDDLTHGRVLLLRNAVVMDLALREPIAVSLYQRSLAVARHAACGNLYLELAPQMAWIGPVWKRESDMPGRLPVRVVAMQPPIVEASMLDAIVSVAGEI